MLPQPNRLLNEKSPYLLQHAYNPVDWYAWGDEAFTKALYEDKPIFLSIGYSSCHWCHVMERESFEDREIARMLNESFISIKVDREERPDIDGIYMTVCRMITGGGGWPMTIIMTPEKKPFFAGTYFPKTSSFNRIGMKELIPRIAELWKTKRGDITESAEEIISALRNNNEKQDEITLDESIFDKAFSYFVKNYDEEYGGFGDAPKFPTPHNMIFLLRYWKRSGNPKALEIAEKTLTAMRIGGIFDHVGFGFHRYSTDSKWLVPHFEKMLYDQAMLSIAYTEMYLATKNIFYKNTCEEILEYVLRDMTSKDGGFFSAEDADSGGVEGKFYLWREKELDLILGDDSEFIKNLFNIEKEGNWFDQAKGTKDGTNILHLGHSVNPDSSSENKTRYNSCLKLLFDTREKRIKPAKDDKILTDWNGLMISALSKASQAFSSTIYSDAAERAANFILENLTDKNYKLFHRFREGEAGVNGNLDDYSFMICGLLDLYETTFKIEYLVKAIKLNEYCLIHFWDKDSGGFFFTSDESEILLLRQKEFYDGAVPSGNSTAILNLLRLSRITGKTDLESKADLTVRAFSRDIASAPFGFTQTLAALDFAIGPSFEIVIASDNNSSDPGHLISKIRDVFIPNKVIIMNDNEKIKEISGFTSEQKPINNQATVYVCKNFICDLPVNSPEDLDVLLK